MWVMKSVISLWCLWFCRFLLVFATVLPFFSTVPAKIVFAMAKTQPCNCGPVESNGSLPPGLWLTSPAGWLPGTRISSGTLPSVIKYGLPLPFLVWVISLDASKWMTTLQFAVTFISQATSWLPIGHGDAFVTSQLCDVMPLWRQHLWLHFHCTLCLKKNKTLNYCP